jgi:dienelactone hydrolase
VTGSTGLAIHLPEAVLRDEAFDPRVTGLDPGERVTLAVETADEQATWSSRATFDAPPDGVLDLAATAPVAGSYDRADPMGPVWSLSPDDDAVDGPFGIDLDPLGSHDLAYTAEAGERTVAGTVVVRHAAPGVTRHDATPAGFGGSWFEPAGDGPHPAVLVLHGSGGRPKVADAALLASRGYAAFALRYLGTADLPDTLPQVPVEYAQDALTWFLDRGAVAAGGVGVYGESMGGMLALLLASVDERVAAIVSDAGSPFVFCGETSPWSLDGEPVPCVRPLDQPPDTWWVEVDGARDTRELFVQMLAGETANRRRDATIAVEDADAPLLFLSGSDDGVWPASAFGNALLARLDAVGYEQPYDHLTYRDAGHVVGSPYRPTTWRPTRGDTRDGGDPAAHARASADAWPRALDLFDRALPG